MQTEKSEKELYVVLEAATKNEMELGSPKHQVELVKAIQTANYQNSYIGKVEEFMITFNQSIPKGTDIVGDIPKEVLKLRGSLLLEEVLEFIEACGQEVASQFVNVLHDKSVELHKRVETQIVPQKYDVVEAMDALCDIQYVLSGAILATGLTPKFDECFENVHESNMSKACTSYAQAQETMDNYTNSGTGCYIDVQKGTEGVWLVLRNGDKKLLKSNGYTPANIKGILMPTKTE